MILTDISVEEYFDELYASDIKLEYHAGEVVAMAGAQVSHNRILINLIHQLADCLEKRGCELFSSNQLLKLESCDKYVFPDLMIVCQEPIFENTHRGLEALINPSIIIEILSDSTEKFDKTQKLECYQALESLNEYVLVSTNRKRVEVFKKITDDEWLQHIYTQKNKSIKIDGCEIELEEIYKRVIL